MKAVPYILGISQGVVKEIGSRHTLACCLCKLRSCLEAGKKQPRVWLEYVCDVEAVHLYPSFAARLVHLWSPFDVMEDIRYIHGGYVEVSRWIRATSTEVSRRCNGNPTEVYASEYSCSSAHEVDFVDILAFVHSQ